MVMFFQKFLETDYRSFIYSLDLPQEFTEKLIGVIPFTIESLSKFGEFIRSLEVIPLTHTRLKRAKNFFRDLFKEKYLLDYNTSSLLEITEKKIGTLTEDMRQISGDDLQGYFETLVERNLIPLSSNEINDYLMTYFRTKAKEYFDFCKGSNLVPAEREPSYEWTPIYKRTTAPLASYIPCGPYETMKKGGIFWICPAKEGLTRDEFLANKFIYHRQFFNSIIIHELIGHHLQSDRISDIEQDVYKFSNNLTSDEGFALYVEEVFTEEYAKTLKDRQEAEEMVFFQKKAELMRAHRVYVDVSLGTGRISLEEAIRYFAEKNSLPFETAKAECEKYYLNPGVASSYLMGKIEIMKVREYLGQKFKKDFSLPFFHKGLINYGSIPIPLIERSMREKLFVSEKVIY
jgi:hypothetical protein